MKEIEKLFKSLNNLYDLKTRQFMEKWDRLLPLNEMIIDRWEKAKKLKFGEGTSIYDSSLIFGNVKVGENTWIGPFTILDGSGGVLTIGNYCSISTGVQIYTHDSVKWAITGGKAEYEKSPTIIGNCCYVGPFSLIAKSVKIGDHSIIGAFSYVDRDISDYSVVRGQPARVVGKVKIKNETEVEIEYF